MRDSLMLASTLVLAVITIVLLLPSLSDVLGLARQRRPLPRTGSNRANELPRFLFLVPAHNEELLIESCLRSLLQLQYPKSHVDVVVVADNCTDGTAGIVRAAGVGCLERYDTVRLGKPFAIAWALEQSDLDAYEAVVIVDADSIVDAQFAAAIAGASPISDKALQCYNDVSNRTENALTRMAAVFSAMRCRFINEFKTRVRLNCSLGNGLCIGTGVLRRLGWGAFSISEDTELYARLTVEGVRIESVASARIFSQEARSLRQSGTQRRRWTVGNLEVLRLFAWRLVRSPRIGFAQKLDSLAELTAPAPAIHLATAIGIVVIAAAFELPRASVLATAAAISLIRPMIYATLGVLSDPDPRGALAAFSFFPFYMFWRLGIQAAAIMGLGTATWVRTERHVERTSN